MIWYLNGTPKSFRHHHLALRPSMQHKQQEEAGLGKQSSTFLTLEKVLHQAHTEPFMLFVTWCPASQSRGNSQWHHYQLLPVVLAINDHVKWYSWGTNVQKCWLRTFWDYTTKLHVKRAFLFLMQIFTSSPATLTTYPWRKWPAWIYWLASSWRFTSLFLCLCTVSRRYRNLQAGIMNKYLECANNLSTLLWLVHVAVRHFVNTAL